MSIEDRADHVAQEFEYGRDKVRKATKHFLQQMQEGLHVAGATMAQIPSYVTTVPDGTEKGLYLALDLGGTNVRVCSVDLHGNTKFTITQRKAAVPPELMRAKTAKELFQFLARQIELFLQTHHTDRLQAHLIDKGTLKKEDFLRLGFTFSFAFEQRALHKGTLLYWTKGYEIPDAIGQDICGLLQEQIDELHLPVHVTALVNDTVGTLVARSYQSPGSTTTLLGAIFGTGTNGAYVEKRDNVTKLKLPDADDDGCPAGGDMILNTEWGSFDNELSILPNTSYDADVDRECIHPGIQLFEKRVSGMFLGETLRYTLLKIAPHSNTMIIPKTSPLYTQYSINTSFFSVTAGDDSIELSATRAELKKILDIDASREDAIAVKKLVIAIGTRAGRLAGVAIAAVVLKSGRLSNIAESTNGKISLTSYQETEHQPSKVTPLAYTKSSPILTLYRRMLRLFRQWHSWVFPAPKIEAPVPQIVADGIIDIGVDGSVIEHYPGFEDSIRSTLRDIEEIGIEGEKRIRIGVAKDGSGVGAALIARMADLRSRGV